MIRLNKRGFSDEQIIEQSLSKLSLNEVHERLLFMVHAFDIFCKKHNLVYYPAGGTLIGAIRHNGFIPWDDDVDFYMPRSDYQKLISFKQINNDIDIVTLNSGDEYYHPFQHCNLSDNKTIIMSKQLRENTGKGQFVDIFPLDNVPDNERARKAQMRVIYNLCRLCSYSVAAKRQGNTLVDRGIRVISVILRNIDLKHILTYIDKASQKYNDTNCKKWGPILKDPKDYLIWDKAWFEKTIRHKFENIEIDIPEGYDSILRHTFGDYMIFPPEDKRRNQHEIEVYWRK